MEATETKAEQESGILDQRPGERGSLCDVFLLLRDNAECFFLSFVIMRDRQSDGGDMRGGKQT